MKKLIDYFLEIQGIKDVKRYAPYKEMFHESVAGHSFLMIVLAIKLIEELKLDLDFKQVIKLITHHDYGEIGLEFDFANVATVTKQDKQRKEVTEAVQIKKLSDKYGAEIQALHNEYSNPTTREGMFVKAIDKIEPMFFVITRGLENIHPNDQKGCAARANPTIKNFPELIPFYRELQSRMKAEYQRIGFEWKKEYEL